MKALTKTKPGPGLWLEDIPVPQMGTNDVLIKIEKTAICGTDIHIFNWDEWSKKTIKTPMVIGHEFVGTVDQMGSNVHDDPKCIGVNRDGAFAEYLSIPVSNVWHCDPGIPMDVLSCFDPFGNAVHTTLSYDLVGEDVLITGAGPIGCMAVAVAKHAGARYVVITDVNPYRLELAKRMGPTLTLDVRSKNIKDAVKKLDMKEGFDVGLEMSGSPDAFKGMLENMCHGGKIALLGIMPQTAIDWDYVVFNGLTIKGIYGREMYETWYKATMLIQKGLDISPIITHRFDYTDYLKAFDVMRSGESGKVILNWMEE